MIRWLTFLCLTALPCWAANFVTYGGQYSLQGQVQFAATPFGNPSNPTGLSPANNANHVVANVTLSWNPAGGATSYNVYLDTVNGTTLVSTGQTGTT